MKSNIIKECLDECEIVSQLNEGVSYNGASFDFRYNKDNTDDIVGLCDTNVHQVDLNGIGVYYYAYYFNPSVNRSQRTQFIHDLKFSGDAYFANERDRFIRNACGNLDRRINLTSYDLIVYPQTQSVLVTELLHEIYKRMRPNNSVASFELIKELPKNITFDYSAFKADVLSKTTNGRANYTEEQKQEVLSHIKQMMDEIHNLDYFSIARNVKKHQWRQYIANYLKFKSDDDERLYKAITSSNVLVIDDISTSGTTLHQILKVLRSVNNSNNLTLFTLIGKEL